MGFKDKDLVGLFAHVQEARTKAMAKGQTRVVLEVNENEEDEKDEEGEEEDRDDFHIHVREGREDEATSRGLGDALSLFRLALDTGEAIATSIPSFKQHLIKFNTISSSALTLWRLIGAFNILRTRLIPSPMHFITLWRTLFLSHNLLSGLLLLLLLSPLHLICLLFLHSHCH